MEDKLIDPDRNKYGLKLIKEDNRNKHRQAIRNKIELKDSDVYSPSEGKKKSLYPANERVPAADSENPLKNRHPDDGWHKDPYQNDSKSTHIGKRHQYLMKPNNYPTDEPIKKSIMEPATEKAVDFNDLQCHSNGGSNEYIALRKMSDDKPPPYGRKASASRSSRSPNDFPSISRSGTPSQTYIAAQARSQSPSQKDLTMDPLDRHPNQNMFGLSRTPSPARKRSYDFPGNKSFEQNDFPQFHKDRSSEQKSVPRGWSPDELTSLQRSKSSSFGEKFANTSNKIANTYVEKDKQSRSTEPIVLERVQRKSVSPLSTFPINNKKKTGPRSKSHESLPKSKIQQPDQYFGGSQRGINSDDKKLLRDEEKLWITDSPRKQSQEQMSSKKVTKGPRKIDSSKSELDNAPQNVNDRRREPKDTSKRNIPTSNGSLNQLHNASDSMPSKGQTQISRSMVMETPIGEREIKLALAMPQSKTEQVTDKRLSRDVKRDSHPSKRPESMTPTKTAKSEEGNQRSKSTPRATKTDAEEQSFFGKTLDSIKSWFGGGKSSESATSMVDHEKSKVESKSSQPNKEKLTTSGQERTPNPSRQISKSFGAADRVRPSISPVKRSKSQSRSGEPEKELDKQNSLNSSRGRLNEKSNINKISNKSKKESKENVQYRIPEQTKEWAGKQTPPNKINGHSEQMNRTLIEMYKPLSFAKQIDKHITSASDLSNKGSDRSREAIVYQEKASTENEYPKSKTKTTTKTGPVYEEPQHVTLKYPQEEQLSVYEPHKPHDDRETYETLNKFDQKQDQGRTSVTTYPDADSFEKPRTTDREERPPQQNYDNRATSPEEYYDALENLSSPKKTFPIDQSTNTIQDRPPKSEDQTFIENQIASEGQKYPFQSKQNLSSDSLNERRLLNEFEQLEREVEHQLQSDDRAQIEPSNVGAKGETYSERLKTNDRKLAEPLYGKASDAELLEYILPDEVSSSQKVKGIEKQKGKASQVSYKNEDDKSNPCLTTTDALRQKSTESQKAYTKLENEQSRKIEFQEFKVPTTARPPDTKAKEKSATNTRAPANDDKAIHIYPLPANTLKQEKDAEIMPKQQQRTYINEEEDLPKISPLISMKVRHPPSTTTPPTGMRDQDQRQNRSERVMSPQKSSSIKSQVRGKSNISPLRKMRTPSPNAAEAPDDQMKREFPLMHTLDPSLSDDSLDPESYDKRETATPTPTKQDPSSRRKMSSEISPQRKSMHSKDPDLIKSTRTPPQNKRDPSKDVYVYPLPTKKLNATQLKKIIQQENLKDPSSRTQLCGKPQARKGENKGESSEDCFYSASESQSEMPVKNKDTPNKNKLSPQTINRQRPRSRQSIDSDSLTFGREDSSLSELWKTPPSKRSANRFNRQRNYERPWLVGKKEEQRENEQERKREPKEDKDGKVRGSVSKNEKDDDEGYGTLGIRDSRKSLQKVIKPPVDKKLSTSQNRTFAPFDLTRSPVRSPATKSMRSDSDSSSMSSPMIYRKNLSQKATESPLNSKRPPFITTFSPNHSRRQQFQTSPIKKRKIDSTMSSPSVGPKMTVRSPSMSPYDFSRWPGSPKINSRSPSPKVASRTKTSSRFSSRSPSPKPVSKWPDTPTKTSRSASAKATKAYHDIRKITSRSPSPKVVMGTTDSPQRALKTNWPNNFQKTSREGSPKFDSGWFDSPKKTIKSANPKAVTREHASSQTGNTSHQMKSTKPAPATKKLSSSGKTSKATVKVLEKGTTVVKHPLARETLSNVDWNEWSGDSQTSLYQAEEKHSFQSQPKMFQKSPTKTASLKHKTEEINLQKTFIKDGPMQGSCRFSQAPCQSKKSPSTGQYKSTSISHENLSAQSPLAKYDRTNELSPASLRKVPTIQYCNNENKENQKRAKSYDDHLNAAHRSQTSSYENYFYNEQRPEGSRQQKSRTYYHSTDSIHPVDKNGDSIGLVTRNKYPSTLRVNFKNLARDKQEKQDEDSPYEEIFLPDNTKERKGIEREKHFSNTQSQGSTEIYKDNLVKNQLPAIPQKGILKQAKQEPLQEKPSGKSVQATGNVSVERPKTVPSMQSSKENMKLPSKPVGQVETPGNRRLTDSRSNLAGENLSNTKGKTTKVSLQPTYKRVGDTITLKFELDQDSKKQGNIKGLDAKPLTFFDSKKTQTQDTNKIETQRPKPYSPHDYKAQISQKDDYIPTPRPTYEADDAFQTFQQLSQQNVKEEKLRYQIHILPDVHQDNKQAEKYPKVKPLQSYTEKNPQSQTAAYTNNQERHYEVRPVRSPHRSNSSPYRTEKKRSGSYDGDSPARKTSLNRSISPGTSRNSSFDGGIFVESRGPIHPYIGYIERKDQERNLKKQSSLSISDDSIANSFPQAVITADTRRRTNNTERKIPGTESEIIPVIELGVLQKKDVSVSPKPSLTKKGSEAFLHDDTKDQSFNTKERIEKARPGDDVADYVIIMKKQEEEQPAIKTEKNDSKFSCKEAPNRELVLSEPCDVRGEKSSTQVKKSEYFEIKLAPPKRFTPPSKFEKYVSERSKTPTRDSRGESPERSRSNTPNSLNRSGSPYSHNRTYSPYKERSRSPSKQIGTTSPYQRSRSVSPYKQSKSEISFQQHRVESPTKHYRSKSPNKENRTISPYEQNRFKRMYSPDRSQSPHKSPTYGSFERQKSDDHIFTEALLKSPTKQSKETNQFNQKWPYSAKQKEFRGYEIHGTQNMQQTVSSAKKQCRSESPSRQGGARRPLKQNSLRDSFITNVLVECRSTSPIKTEMYTNTYEYKKSHSPYKMDTYDQEKRPIPFKSRSRSPYKETPSKISATREVKCKSSIKRHTDLSQLIATRQAENVDEQDSTIFLDDYPDSDDTFIEVPVKKDNRSQDMTNTCDNTRQLASHDDRIVLGGGFKYYSANNGQSKPRSPKKKIDVSKGSPSKDKATSKPKPETEEKIRKSPDGIKKQNKTNELKTSEEKSPAGGKTPGTWFDKYLRRSPSFDEHKTNSQRTSSQDELHRVKDDLQESGFHDLVDDDQLWEQKIREYINKNKRQSPLITSPTSAERKSNISHMEMQSAHLSEYLEKPTQAYIVNSEALEAKYTAGRVVLKGESRDILEFHKRPKSDKRRTYHKSDENISMTRKELPPRSIVKPLNGSNSDIGIIHSDSDQPSHNPSKWYQEFKDKHLPYQVTVARPGTRSLGHSWDESFDSFEYHEKSLGILDKNGNAKRNSQLLKANPETEAQSESEKGSERHSAKYKKFLQSFKGKLNRPSSCPPAVSEGENSVDFHENYREIKNEGGHVTDYVSCEEEMEFSTTEDE